MSEDDSLQAELNRLFGVAAIRRALSTPVEQFVDGHEAQLRAMQDSATALTEPVLAAMPAALDADIDEITSSWKDKDARNEFLTRHLGFPYWDAMIYPIEAVSGVGERDHVEVMRISPHEATELATVKEKELKGDDLGHFGAFFSLEGRQKDYFWGRLDGMERLVTLLLTPPGDTVGWARRDPKHPDYDADRLRDRRADIEAGARAIVGDERKALKKIGRTLDDVEKKVSGGYRP